MRSFQSFFIAAALIAPQFVVSSPAFGGSNEILIGQSVDLSGPNGDIGKDYLTGARVYFDHINAQGGLAGRKLTLIAQDNQGRPEKSNEITRGFLRDKVDVLFGYFGEGSLKSLEATGYANQSAKPPVVAPFSGLDSATPNADVFFLRPGYATEARRAVDYYAAQGLNRFAVVASRNRYGEVVAKAIRHELEKRQLKMLSEVTVAPDAEASKTQMDALRRTGAQVIILVLDTIPAAQFVKAYRSLDPGAHLLGLSRINTQTFYELAGADATGTVVTQVVPNPRNWSIPVVMEHDRLMKKFRDEPPSHATLEGFLAAKLLVMALRSAGKDVDVGRMAGALRKSQGFDLGGFYVRFEGAQQRGSRFVDANVISRSGKLLN